MQTYTHSTLTVHTTYTTCLTQHTLHTCPSCSVCAPFMCTIHVPHSNIQMPHMLHLTPHTHNHLNLSIAHNCPRMPTHTSTLQGIYTRSPCVHSQQTRPLNFFRTPSYVWISKTNHLSGNRLVFSLHFPQTFYIVPLHKCKG